MLAAFLASFLAAYPVPTVGASALVYAMTGMYIGITLCNRHIRITDRKRYVFYLATLVCYLLLSFLRRNSNFPVHVYSLCGGFLYAAVMGLCSRKQ